MRNSKVSLSSWLFALLAVSSCTAYAAPEAGWYWNPAESGRGFFIETQNGITFIGAYLYDTDGHALWYVAGGMNKDPYNYTGPLYNMSKGQTLFGPYAAAVGPNNVGTITVHFTDDTHATVIWPGGKVAIEREIFGTGPADFQPWTGWWWNADQGGSGYSIEVQGKNLFIVGFMYDDGGRAVWYFSAGPMSTPTTYHGNVLQFANGQTMGGPYQSPGPPTTVATLDVVFTAVNRATLTFKKPVATQDGAAPKQAEEQSLRVVVPEFVNPLTQFPPAWSGGFTLVGSTDASEPNVYTSHTDFSFAVSVNLVQDKDNPGTYVADLSKAAGQNSYNLKYMTVAGTCTGFAEGATSPGAFSADQLQASLNVGLSGLYTLTIDVNYPITTGYECPGPPPFKTTLPFIYTFALKPREGAIYTGIVGAEIVLIPIPSGFGSARLDWSFAPCDKCVPTP